MEQVPEDDGNSQSEQQSSVGSKYKSIKKNKEHSKKEKKQLHPGHNFHSQVAKYLHSNRRMSVLGLFESQSHKYQRIRQFLKDSINEYYVDEVTNKQFLLRQFSQNKVSLNSLLQSEPVWNKSITEEEVFNYGTLLQQGNQMQESVIVIKKQSKYYIVCVNFSNNDLKIQQVNELQAHIFTERFKNAPKLKDKINQYSQISSKISNLSQLSFEIILLYNNFEQNQLEVYRLIRCLEERITRLTKKQPQSHQNYYNALIINKNIRKGLDISPIDQLSYYQLAQNEENPDDNIGKTLISQKKDFQEFIKKKRKRKGGKIRSVLKTACLGCFSPYYEQYNPFKVCPECHMRFHQLCYSLTSQSICDLCLHKKTNTSIKAKIQCFICPQRSLLYRPIDVNRSIHIFCMLVNKLWRFNNQSLQFQEPLLKSEKIMCNVCSNVGQFVYKCQQEGCMRHAHPSCAFLNGWQMSYEDSIKLKCCKGVNLGQNERKRKFILNYKKYIWNLVDKQ